MNNKNWFGTDVTVSTGYKADPSSNNTVGDISGVNVTRTDDGLLKAYIPGFLYKPPFGYPRQENLPLIRQLAKNPYVFSVIKTLADEAASTDGEIVYKKGKDPYPEMDKIQEEIKHFFDNPNKNKESWSSILRAVIKDIAEVDSGVMVKVFTLGGEFSQIFARDGASFLKNPDPFGYMGNRAEYVKPTNDLGPELQPGQILPEGVNEAEPMIRQYGSLYKESAAYFQYGTTAMALPVPFGRREIIYAMQNPKSNSIYGTSPVQILADVIMTLVYGANYNLDFYMNNNMPEGIIQVLGADKDQIDAFRARFDQQFRVKDEVTGFMRKQSFKFPIVNQEAKITPFQLDPKVMQIIEQQEWFTKLVWACFGITADEMGFTQDSNKAVSGTQTKLAARKGIKPMLKILKYHIDKEIISEWGEEASEYLEYKWDDYELEEDIKQHTLYKMQIDMGIKTPEMVADETGIDVKELVKQKEANEAKEAEKFEREASFNQQPMYQQPEEKPKPKTKEKKKPEEKAEKFENDLEKELVTSMKAKAKELKNALNQLNNSELDKIQ